MRGIQKTKKLRGSFSSEPACFYSAPTHLRMRAQPASHYRSAIADGRDPPIGSLFPPNSPPLLCAHVSLPVSSPSLSRPRVDSSSPQCRHLCAYPLASSRRHSCNMASCRRSRMRSALALAALAGCQCQPLDGVVLEQSASLTELQVPKARHLDRGIATPSRA
jgi:hypothetical protein